MRDMSPAWSFSLKEVFFRRPVPALKPLSARPPPPQDRGGPSSHHQGQERRGLFFHHHHRRHQGRYFFVVRLLPRALPQNVRLCNDRLCY